MIEVRTAIQYTFDVAGEGHGVEVTVSLAEDAHLCKKAKRLGVSVEKLLERSINQRVRARPKNKQPVDMYVLICQVIKSLAAPSKTNKK